MDVKLERNRLFRAIQKAIDTNVQFVVYMVSEDYGNEEFKYVSFNDALAGYKRLRKEIEKAKDGVERTLTFAMRMEAE